MREGSGGLAPFAPNPPCPDQQAREGGNEPDGSSQERLQVDLFSHARNRGNTFIGEAKFWLDPEIELAYNLGLERKQLREIEAIVEEHAQEIIDAWNDHFGS